MGTVVKIASQNKVQENENIQKRRIVALETELSELEGIVGESNILIEESGIKEK